MKRLRVSFFLLPQFSLPLSLLLYLSTHSHNLCFISKQIEKKKSDDAYHIMKPGSLG